MRFYFDVDDGNRLLHDDEGSEICSMRQMREAAMRMLPEIAGPPNDTDYQMVSVKVRDGAGRYVLVAAMNLCTSWLDPAFDISTLARQT